MHISFSTGWLLTASFGVDFQSCQRAGLYLRQLSSQFSHSDFSSFCTDSSLVELHKAAPQQKKPTQTKRVGLGLRGYRELRSRSAFILARKPE